MNGMRCDRCGGSVAHDLKRERPPKGIGMPAGIWLTKFGALIYDFFGHPAYHVGSSLTGKTWRDVDVRLLLPDDEFARLFGTISSSETNARLAAVTLAFAALGEHMTGLPIDFQIQPRAWANERYPGPRNALIEIREQIAPDAPSRASGGEGGKEGK